MTKHRSLKKLREATEAELEPLLVIPHSDSYGLIVLVQSQGGIYHVKRYSSSYMGYVWYVEDVIPPTANIREAYRAINAILEGELP